MKIGKLDSIYHYVRDKSRFSTYFMYIKTEEQILFGINIDGKIDNELKEKIKSIFENIDIFEIEMGYVENWNKSYMILKEEVKEKFFGIIILGKDELIQEKFGTEIIEYDYIYEDSEIEELKKHICPIIKFKSIKNKPPTPD